MCGWTQDKTDQFDWTPKAGHTTSSGTGPSADHTSGTATGGLLCSSFINFLEYLYSNFQSTVKLSFLDIYVGKYIYIETSAPRRRGDKARILSPQVPGGSPLCFQFFYHMYGPHIGTLNVFVKSVQLNGTQTVWTKSLNQGNKWVFAQVTIPQVYTNYQVR